MADYPDWTRLHQLIGTNIMQAVDVQGGYIMLPVDWQSQFAGVFLQPEWSALQATDKNFHAAGVDLAFGGTAIGFYDVPEGKTLYICGYTFGMGVSTDTDYDHHLWAQGFIENNTTSVYLAVIGGQGGGGMVFSKPHVIPAENRFQMTLRNYSNLTCVGSITAWGYEI